MAYCPSCRAEYREGIVRCAHCEVDLVDELPPEVLLGVDAVEAAVADGTALVVARGPLQSVSGMRDALADHRVPAVVRGNEESKDYTGAASVFDVLVAPADQEAAAAALAADFQGMIVTEGLDPAAADAVVDLDAGGEIVCPACGTSFDASASAECPECGLFLGVPDGVETGEDEEDEEEADDSEDVHDTEEAE